ncbi:MAG: helix-turn-helix domain-containing protein [Candidatus Omnitrophica bacterium]|nr:helix-turn-helix domain-containing protein [Candidatus Omnitrophota bacterium]
MQENIQFLTPEETCNYLRVNIRTVYRWAHMGLIPALRAGKQWRIRRSDVEAWLARKDASERAKLEPLTDKIGAALGIGQIQTTLHNKINLYKKRAREVENYLTKNPQEWGRFQSEFNSEVNGIFREIMNFEKSNLANGRSDRVDKLKRIFINRIRGLFMHKEYSAWSIGKPLGYAGDYKIIDKIYQNDPKTTGFDRLFDNYYQMSVISVGVRNRKEDFKRLITGFVDKRKNQKLRIMNLGSGSCREVKELLSSRAIPGERVTFDCYDNDERAIAFAKELLSGFKNINFYKENALRLAAEKDIQSKIRERHDLIYSTGLFDYLANKTCVRLVKNLKLLLRNGSLIMISNVRDRYSNPSVHYMEWAGDWPLVYRDEDEFKKIFIEAGFKEDELSVQYEQQGIMQYIIASNRIRHK